MQRSMQIKSISTEDLTVNKKSISNDIFVIIKTDPANNYTSKKIETGPNTGHVKHDMVEVDMPMHVGFISLEVYHYKGKNHDRSELIGVARIPTSDFLGSYMPDGYVNFLSYRLRDVNGVRNGIINLSVKMAPSEYVPMVSPPAMPELGVPVCQGKISPNIVTGVPVWHAQPRTY